MRRLEIATERWPIAGNFTISRGSKSEAIVVTVTIREGAIFGRGECVPYARYGETVDGIVAEIRRLESAITDGLTTAQLLSSTPAGAARNAVDCALLDLEAKQQRTTVPAMLGVGSLMPVETAYTLSLSSSEKMAEAARLAADRTILKLKLGGAGDAERVAAVRRSAPEARLIVDANEAWSEDNFDANMEACAAAGVELIEQPLSAVADAYLARGQHPVPICADESVHTAADIDRLTDRYDAINIKLDKAGGLTAALAMLDEAESKGLKIMVGCMVGTSLAMAPALVLAQRADFVDLDGPLLLSRDRDPGLVYHGSWIEPPPRELWG
jgi:L-alanine-DL-glutamate epimerase-like enolase superfamily enzyme